LFPKLWLLEKSKDVLFFVGIVFLPEDLFDLIQSTKSGEQQVGLDNVITQHISDSEKQQNTIS
jgi:hypothetical protein